MSHTPGPWTTRSAFCDNAPNRAIIRRKEWGAPTIADCGEDTESNRANARLIASAPDMLEALRTILETASIDADDGALALKAISEVRIDARAAIAKATDPA